MAGKVYVRDLQILKYLQIELSQFNSGSNKVLDDVARTILGTKEFLQSRIGYWNAELRRREAALRSCQSSSNEYRDCSSEIAAVREASTAIEKLQKLSTKLEQAIGEYQPHSNRFRKVLDGKINKAKGDLQRSVEKYQRYLEPQKPSYGSTESSHDRFREEMGLLSSLQKGSWGERAVIAEAEEMGHVVLVEHWNNATARGFDCVSTDLSGNELHIWEAKNFTNRSVYSRDLSAWQDQAKKRFRKNWEDILSSVSDGSLRDNIKRAVNAGKVTYHLRLGPHTKLSQELEKVLNQEVPGATYDWKRYSPNYFLNLGSNHTD